MQCFHCVYVLISLASPHPLDDDADDDGSGGGGGDSGLALHTD